jgi:hypothetical protein
MHLLCGAIDAKECMLALELADDLAMGTVTFLPSVIDLGKTGCPPGGNITLCKTPVCSLLDTPALTSGLSVAYNRSPSGQARVVRKLSCPHADLLPDDQSRCTVLTCAGVTSGHPACTCDQVVPVNTMPECAFAGRRGKADRTLDPQP